MKTEDRIHQDRCFAHLAANPNENTYKAVKAVAQAFMLSTNLSVAGVTYEPQSKHLGIGVYELSYKRKSVEPIKV